MLQKKIQRIDMIAFLKGPAHCGTTIFRTILGLHPEIYATDHECFPDTIPTDKFWPLQVPQKYFLCKAPIDSDNLMRLFSARKSYEAGINIIRNPLDMMASLYAHYISDRPDDFFEKALSTWDLYSVFWSETDEISVKYENLLEPFLWVDICQGLGIDDSLDLLGRFENTRNKKLGEVKRGPENLIEFRQWQTNSPLRVANDTLRDWLPPAMRNKIENLPSYQKIYLDKN